jgi:hypothetical protein
MTWALAIPLIEQIGLPALIKLWTLATSGKDPTAADWTDLTALTLRHAQSRMLLALVTAGIDPASDKGKMFLALAAPADATGAVTTTTTVVTAPATGVSMP